MQASALDLYAPFFASRTATALKVVALLVASDHTKHFALTQMRGEIPTLRRRSDFWSCTTMAAKITRSPFSSKHLQGEIQTPASACAGETWQLVSARGWFSASWQQSPDLTLVRWGHMCTQVSCRSRSRPTAGRQASHPYRR
jgi:hypothetical protein